MATQRPREYRMNSMWQVVLPSPLIWGLVIVLSWECICNGSCLLGYMKGWDFSLSLQSLTRLLLIQIRICFSAYWKIKTVFSCVFSYFQQWELSLLFFNCICLYIPYRLCTQRLDFQHFFLLNNAMWWKLNVQPCFWQASVCSWKYILYFFLLTTLCH